METYCDQKLRHILALIALELDNLHVHIFMNRQFSTTRILLSSAEGAGGIAHLAELRILDNVTVAAKLLSITRIACKQFAPAANIQVQTDH